MATGNPSTEERLSSVEERLARVESLRMIGQMTRREMVFAIITGVALSMAFTRRHRSEIILVDGTPRPR